MAKCDNSHDGGYKKICPNFAPPSMGNKLALFAFTLWAVLCYKLGLFAA